MMCAQGLMMHYCEGLRKLINEKKGSKPSSATFNNDSKGTLNAIFLKNSLFVNNISSLTVTPGRLHQALKKL